MHPAVLPEIIAQFVGQFMNIAQKFVLCLSDQLNDLGLVHVRIKKVYVGMQILFRVRDANSVEEFLTNLRKGVHDLVGAVGSGA